jgi:hypothetical protein
LFLRLYYRPLLARFWSHKKVVFGTWFSLLWCISYSSIEKTLHLQTSPLQICLCLSSQTSLLWRSIVCSRDLFISLQTGRELLRWTSDTYCLILCLLFLKFPSKGTHFHLINRRCSISEDGSREVLLQDSSSLSHILYSSFLLTNLQLLRCALEDSEKHFSIDLRYTGLNTTRCQVIRLSIKSYIKEGYMKVYHWWLWFLERSAEIGKVHFYHTPCYWKIDICRQLKKIFVKLRFNLPYSKQPLRNSKSLHLCLKTQKEGV